MSRALSCRRGDSGGGREEREEIIGGDSGEGELEINTEGDIWGICLEVGCQGCGTKFTEKLVSKIRFGHIIGIVLSVIQICPEGQNLDGSYCSVEG